MSVYQSISSSEWAANNDFSGTNSSTQIIGQKIDSGHVLKGKIITKVRWYLAREGSSTSGVVYARLLTSTGSTRHTFGSISKSGLGTNVNASTMGITEFVGTSAVTVDEGDIIGIETSAADVKIGSIGTDVSPDGNRARGTSGSIVLDSTKDMYFECDYTTPSTTVNKKLMIKFYPDGNISDVSTGVSSSGFKFWFGMNGKRRYGKGLSRRVRF